MEEKLPIVDRAHLLIRWLAVFLAWAILILYLASQSTLTNITPFPLIAISLFTLYSALYTFLVAFASINQKLLNYTVLFTDLVFLTFIIRYSSGYLDLFYLGYIAIVLIAALYSKPYQAVLFSTFSGAGYLLVSRVSLSLPAFEQAIIILKALILPVFAATISYSYETASKRKETLIPISTIKPKIPAKDVVSPQKQPDQTLIPTFVQNRLKAEIRRAQRYARSLSLAKIEFDDSKALKELKDPDQFENTMEAIARGITKGCRSSDIIGYYKNRDFAVILPETDVTGAFVVAERIREKIVEGKLLKGSTSADHPPTVSIGIANYPVHAANLRGLIKQAKNALNTAKANGRNRVCSPPQKKRESASKPS